MRYYKYTDENYIVSVGTQMGTGDGNITVTEYNTILAAISTKPAAPSGYDYKLRADTLEWELVRLPPIVEEEPEEITLEDALAALERLGVDFNNNV